MRRTSKAATAGSTKRLGKSKPALLACVLAAAVAALALVVGSASGATTRFLVEAFGSAAQPAFPEDRGIAVDQATGEVYVLETSTDEIRRYNADGTPSDFSALGSNVIDGEGAEDAIPEESLLFAFGRSESQIAIDESGGATDGNVYVTESARDQVSIFSSTGAYLGELSAHSGGAFNEPIGVAVDPSGNVYVGDSSSEDLIHKYEPAANPPVDADNVASFNTLAGESSIGTLAAGAGATAGFIFVNRLNGELFKLDASGEVKYQLTTGASTVSVDPTTGHVFAAKGSFGGSEVAEYDASGATEATLVSAFKPGSTAEGVAVKGSSEQVYVSRSGTEEVEVFGPAAVIPDVVTSPPSSNTGVRATLAGTVNPDGVELDECFFEWGKGFGPDPYTGIAPCAETPAEIGAGAAPVAVHADISGLAPQGTNYHYRLVAANPNGTVNGSNQNFATPNTVTATAASAITPTTATLNGTVNPDTATISECLFEWGPEKELLEQIQTYPETAPCVPGPGGITGTSSVAVHAEISGLHPGTTYLYRLKVAYPTGTIVDPPSSPLTVQTAGPAIEAAWSEDVVVSEATLKAAINPEGAATTYRFEYGPTAAYGSQTPELPVGSDSSVHEVSRFLEGLEPGTTYHYRVVATNSAATNVGPDLTFTTYEPLAVETDCANQGFRVGLSANLPNCRAYEMVSPVDKNGGDIVTRCNINCRRTAANQVALDGNKFTYSSTNAFGDAISNLYSNQYMATRGGNGWSTHGISPYHAGVITFPFLPPWDSEIQFKGFSDDLSTAVITDDAAPPLTPDAVSGKVNIYKRDNLNDTYQPLFTKPPTSSDPSVGHSLSVGGHSAGGDHVVFSMRAALTPDVPPIPAAGGKGQLYEFADGQLRLVSVLPNGTANPSYATTGGGRGDPDTRTDALHNAVSRDGDRIYWTAAPGENSNTGTIYIRVNGAETIPVSETISDAAARYWTASADGSKALFTMGELGPNANLYLFNLASESSSLVAGGIQGVMGGSDDLSKFYFASTQALAPGSTGGKDNLYVSDEGSIRFIATLAEGDIGDTGGRGYDVVSESPIFHASRVSPDGNVAAFQSVASLTGYDNRSANNGEPSIEVYLYEAESEELQCVSCRPSGARPEAQPLQNPFSAREDSPARADDGSLAWTAAWLTTYERATYAPRNLSADGNRLFFNAFDALLPQDTNGQQDVYQWEAQGTGDCERPGGCLSLISSGKSAKKSEFVDATPNGRDVFISTESSLVPQDPGLIDIYDAREGGGYPPPPPPPPPCIGDACQHVPAAPNDPTPASAAFRGSGDPAPRKGGHCNAQAKRAAKLSRRAKALRRRAKRVDGKQSRALRRRSARYAKRAKGHSKRASRCRRANRRASR